MLGKLLTYRNGTSDTAGKGRYDDRVLSVRDSILSIRLHTAQGSPRSAVVGYDPTGSGSWARSGQTYGRWSVRWRADRLPGFAFVGLLWPVSNRWSEGELDWPEGGLASTLKGYVHTVGDPRRNAAGADTHLPMYGIWRTTTVEWTPDGVRFLLDDREVLSSAQSPSQPMRLTIQTETAYGATPDPTVSGFVEIDWIAAWTLAGSSGGPPAGS